MITQSLADVVAAIDQVTQLSFVIKVTLALMAGLLLMALVPRARASVRHLMLAATFGSLLVLPAAVVFTTPLLIEVPAPERFVSPAPVARREVVAVPLTAILPRTRATDSGFKLAPLTPRMLLTVAWMLGVLCFLGSLTAALGTLIRMRRNGVPWLDTPGFVREIAARPSRRPIEILLHEDVAAPLTCGVLRPAIMLPSDVRRWSDADVRRALVHEIEHIHRADWVMQLTARATCALYWFHPLVWIALRKLCLEAERACDDAVVRESEGAAYAEQLVALAERMKAASRPPLLAMANRSDLATRVTSLLDATRRRGRAGAAATIAATALTAVVVLAIAPLRAVGVHASAPTGEQTAAAQSERRGSRAHRQLLRAAARGDVEQVAALLNAGANVNATIDGDGSPLIVAAREGQLDAVALLLDRGADPNLAVSGDGNPLIMASREGRLDVVTLLLDRGARIDQVVDGDENALIQASGEGQLAVVKLLVARRADVNARVWVDSGYRNEGEWRTPLSMASKGRHQEVVAFLRSAGARE